MCRIALALLCVLAWAAPAWAQWSLIQERDACPGIAGWSCNVTDDFSSDSTVVVTGITSTTSGATHVVAIQHEVVGRTISSVDCSAGEDAAFSEYHRRATGTPSGTGIDLWAGKCTAGSTSVTIVLSGSTTGNDFVQFAEFSGGASTITEEGTSVGASTATTTTHDAGTVTPTFAGSNLFIGFMHCNNDSSVTMDADFTSLRSGNSLQGAGYRIQTGTTGQNFSLTTSVNRDCNLLLAAFQGAASASTCTGTLLGVGCDD